MRVMSITARRPRFNPKDLNSYDDARLAWRKSLTDMDVRAMAADYWRGDRDACALDAWAEYQERFPDDRKPISKAEKRKKLPKGRKRRST